MPTFKNIVPVVAVILLAFLGGPQLISSTRAPETEPIRLAQQYSSRCATSVGICDVEPQPVGSPCTCPDGNVGTIVP